MNTKLLRQKVLDLAIHGKLLDKAVVEALETTPGYEPASKLLERIRGASLPLATAGKPSSASPSPRGKAPKTPAIPISEDEIPFEIPANWCWCRLGDIVDISSAKRVLKEDWKSEGIPFFRAREIAQLANGEKPIDDLFITNEMYQSLKQNYGIPKPGDLMVSAVGTIGKIYIVKEEDCFYYKDASVIKFSPLLKDINSSWLKKTIESPFLQTQIYAHSNGTTVDTITISTASEYMIPLPPLEEQKLIVEEIERIFALIDTVEQNKTDLETVIKQTKSKILDLAIHGKLVPQDKTDEPASVLFEKIKKEKQLTDVDEIEELPFEIPSSWKWVHLSDVCLKLKRGKSPKYVEKSSYMAFAQKCNQKDGPTSLEKALYIDESSLNRYPPEEYMKKYDTVINSTGTGTLGRVGIYDCDVPEGIKGVFADSHVTTIHPSSYVNPKYVYYFVKNKQRYLESAGEGSTNQKELKVTTIGEMEFPLPPIEEQNRIVTKIESIYDKIDILK